jgi:hypothetical protein
MKNNFVKIISGSVLGSLVILTLALGSAFGQTDSKSTGGGRLEGTWNARVTIRNCQTGAEIRSFDSIGSFMSGGIMIDSTSGVPQALKTPGHGVWSHTRGNTYQFSFKNFNFDSAGNYTGYTIIRHEATLNSRATAYESAGTAEIYAPNGALMLTLCSTTTSSRFE